MDRREFLAAMADGAGTGCAATAADSRTIASSPITNRRQDPACPVPIPGAWSRSTPPRCIDEVTEKVDVPTVQEMIARGMSTLTGDKDPRDSWARFFNAQDFVGIKINASGAPGAMSMPDVVAEITSNLIAVGVKPANIVIHERGGGQILLPKYHDSCPPASASSPPTPGLASIPTSTSK